MPKRHSAGLGVGRKAKRRRRRLYVVMDDGEGYAVRKFDLSSDFESSDDDAEQPLEQRTGDVIEQRLPRAVIGLDSLTGEYFAAIGTKNMVTHTHGRWPDRAVPVFDTPAPRSCLILPRRNAATSNGLGTSSPDLRSAAALSPPMPRTPMGGPSSSASRAETAGTASTFTLDTESESWKRHGEWKLPFFRQAHFDPELDAWVGLSGDLDTFGYLCSSDVPPSLDTSNCKQPPAWKLSKEKMFGQDPAEDTDGAILAYMGSRSKYCLVRCFSVLDEDYDHIYVANKEDRPRRHLLRLTSFSLKYDKNGNLQICAQRQVGCYKLPDVIAPIPNDLQAFWM
ncbi:unnamed protein product [Alopecurus aequalis]